MQSSESLENIRLTYSPTPVPSAPPLDSSAKKISPEEVQALLSAKFGKSVGPLEKPTKGDPFIVVDVKQLKDCIQFLRDDAKLLFTNLNVIAAVDYLAPSPAAPAPAPTAEGAVAAPPAAPAPAAAARVEVVYVLFSYASKSQITLKVKLDRDHPKVSTISDLFRCANWYERECYDMLGVEFEGHPYHQRILLPPDWVGYPLRRDYVFPEEYNGMKVPL